MNKTALLIPHYNNPNGLIRSVVSIEASENIDVFIVDDGSTRLTIDETLIKSVFKANGQINFIYHETNKGIEYALNTGLQNIVAKQQYSYIARLDSDDQCIGPRFTIQQKYLDQHPDIKLLGCNALAVNTKGEVLYNIILPEESAAIKNKMFLNNMFLHPGVMFCTNIIAQVGYYPTNYKAAEDYAYFFTITRLFKTANLQQFLVKYEINPAGISLSRRRQQVGSRIKAIVHNFYFGYYPIYGLLRNIALYFMPNALILFLKRKALK